MTARRLALAVLPLAVHALLAPGSAAAQSAAGDRLVGEVGLGVYARTEVVRDTGTSTMVLPYVYADWGRVFARVDTLGVKLVPLGLGHLELVGRVSTEGWDADRPSLRGLSDRGNPLPVGLGTMQRTRYGAFFVYAMHDLRSGGNYLEATWGSRFDVGRIDPSTPYARTFATQQPVDGTPMPTLAAVFERVKALGAAGVHFNIETKLSPLKPDETPSPEHIVRVLLKVVRDAGMLQRVTIQSFDWRTLREVQAAEPSVRTAYLSIQTANNDNIRDGRWTAGIGLATHGSVPAMVKAAGGAVWSPNAGALSEPLLRQAQSLGLRVIPWTVNQVADMERLIGWGVDGLITDYPDRLREVMARRGLPLPRRHPEP